MDHCCTHHGACQHGISTTRRNFLGGSIAMGGAVLSGGLIARAQTAAHRIDVHHHISPPALKDAVTRTGYSILPRTMSWTLENTLADMEKTGTATAMTSLSMPVTTFLEKAADAASVARGCNEWAVQKMRDGYPGRFGVLAALPMPHVEETMKEIAYAFDVLKVDGIGFLTSYGNKWLGHADFAPIMEELNRRGAVVFVHPNNPNCCQGLMPDVSDGTIEFTTDTARAIANLIFTGTSTKNPNIKFIFNHGGGMMPMVMDRLTRQWVQNEKWKPFNSDKVKAELARFHYDTALAANPPAMAAIRTIAPTSQLLFATDYPFRDGKYQADDLQKLFKTEELQMIEGDNARRLFPNLRKA